MSYRQSSYQPLAYDLQGPPLRPFDGKQKIGVAMVAAALLVFAYSLVSETGLVPPIHASTVPAAPLSLIGMLLIHSRRRVIPPEEQDAFRAKQRRDTWLGLGLATVVILLPVAIAYLIRHR